MTEINLTLSIEKVSKFEGEKTPANVKVLRLELSYPTDVGELNKFYEKVSPKQVLNKISIGFFDGAEDEIYNKLLNKSGRFNFFQLSWEKEKVNFLMPGKEEDEKNDAKPRINFLSVSKKMEIELKPQFAGIIKINYGKSDNKQPSPSPNNSELDKQIASLRDKVQALEEKRKKIPTSDNSDANQQQKREIQQQIQQLKNELKEKEKEKEQQPNKGDNFPWKTVFGIGGTIIIILVIIFLIKKLWKVK